KFVKESSILLVTVLDSDPSNHPYTDKFFVSLATRFFYDLLRVESLKAKYREVATSYKGQGLFFLVGDAESGQHTLQVTISFCISQSFSLLRVYTSLSRKANVMVDQIESWMKDFRPIPAENNKPVKVVVAESLDDIVYKSGKNVLIEFYAPSCGHCQVSPILDEVALKLQNDPSVIIAKLDATENDIPSEPFDGKGFPPDHLLEISEWKQYEGDRTKEDFISFIEKKQQIHMVTRPLVLRLRKQRGLRNRPLRTS
ncbi:LOW QUALITY PROTEIN: hypothetical protein HID58_071921, partial [Brassica napus]